MAERRMKRRRFGPPCPGCTPDGIAVQIARFPAAYPTCRACLEHGALFEAEQHKKHKQEQQKQRDCEDATNLTGRPIGRDVEAGDAQG